MMAIHHMVQAIIGEDADGLITGLHRFSVAEREELTFRLWALGVIRIELEGYRQDVSRHIEGLNTDLKRLHGMEERGREMRFRRFVQSQCMH